MKQISEQEMLKAVSVSVAQIQSKYLNLILKVDPHHFMARRIRCCGGKGQYPHIYPSPWPRQRRQSIIKRLKEQCEK